MSKEDADRSGRGFWSFLRKKKAPFADESFEAQLAAYWETKRSVLDKSSREPSEPSEKAKERRSDPPEWEISEEVEISKPEAPDEGLGEAEVPEPGAAERESSEELEARGPELLEGKRSEKAEARRSEPPWEISEEAEISEPEASEGESSEEVEVQESEVPDRESSEEAETREPEEITLGSGSAVEELRVLEEQVASLESCIAERLELRP